MRARVDEHGRVIIPPEYRDRLDIGPGDVVEMTVTNGGVGLFASEGDSGISQDAHRNSSLESASCLSETLAMYRKEFRGREFESSRVATIRLKEDSAVVIPSLYREKMNINHGDLLNLVLENGEARIALSDQVSCGHEPSPTDHTQSYPYKVRVGHDGKVELPREAQELLGVKPGDAIFAKIEDETLRLYTFAWATNRVQEYAKNHPPDNGTLLSEELIQERRAEAQIERYG